MVIMTTDKFLRVPLELAQALEEIAVTMPEYNHSRAKWADLARDSLLQVVKKNKGGSKK